MKKLLLVLSGLLSIVMMMASTSGAPSGVAGDPATGSATCRNCHSCPNLSPITGVITSTVPPAGYSPGSTYTITANFSRAGHTKFGFEISPQSPSGTLLGSMQVTSAQTKLVGSNKYITHTASGTNGNGSKTWSFKWTAPATGLGPVTFYGSFNATNSNNMSSGDSTFKSTLVVSENTTSIQDSQEKNLFVSIFPNPAVDRVNIKFTLKESSLVSADVFDINGNKRIIFFSEENMEREAGGLFDISPFPEGIYFLRLKVDTNYSIYKIIKIK